MKGSEKNKMKKREMLDITIFVTVIIFEIYVAYLVVKVMESFI